MNIFDKLQEYDKLREQEKLIKKRKDALAKEIKEHVAKHGNKDSKGSYYANEGNYVYGSVAKKSIKLNEEKAKLLLNEKGIYREAVKIVEVVDEDALAQFVADGTLTMEELEAVTDVKVTYSLDLKTQKEEEPNDIPEVQVAPREASTKKKRLIFKPKR